MRFFFTVLLVLSLSAPATASEFWRIAAHSMHESNYWQTKHFKYSGSAWYPNSDPNHFLGSTRNTEVIRAYFDFWHHVLDAAPHMMDEQAVRVLYRVFTIAKAYVVAHNNVVTNSPKHPGGAKVFMVRYSTHF